MAAASACNLGSASNVNLVHLHTDFRSPRCTKVFAPHKIYALKLLFEAEGPLVKPEPKQAKGIYKFNWRLTNSFIVRCRSSSWKNDGEVIEVEGNKSKKVQSVPGTLEVESLLTTICDTTSIAEFTLEIEGFRLYVKRDFEKGETSAVPSVPPFQTSITSQITGSNGSAALTSLALPMPKPSSTSIKKIIDTASDEGLVILQSPKVGLFRRSRTIKGKRALPSCKEKQQVKEGQILCYIEQLGGEIPIESDVSGEVIKILREDGEPVGYGDALIAILPSFPGIKKLQ